MSDNILKDKKGIALIINEAADSVEIISENLNLVEEMGLLTYRLKQIESIIQMQEHAKVFQQEMISQEMTDIEEGFDGILENMEGTEH